MVAEEKSDWEPKTIVNWLGLTFNFEIGMLYVKDNRLQHVVSTLSDLKGKFVHREPVVLQVKTLASVVGQIQSMVAALGPLSHAMTKYCHVYRN